MEPSDLSKFTPPLPSNTQAQIRRPREGRGVGGRDQPGVREPGSERVVSKGGKTIIEGGGWGDEGDPWWPFGRSPRRAGRVRLAGWKSYVFCMENIGFRGLQGTAPGTLGGGLSAPGTNIGRPRTRTERAGDTGLIKNKPWESFRGHLVAVCVRF